MRILVPIINSNIDFDIKDITCDEGKVVGKIVEENGKIWLEIEIEDFDAKNRLQL